MTSLREKWAAGGETLGLWLSLPSFVSAEIAARQPVDYVCVDTQHGVNDYLQAASMIQAIELVGRHADRPRAVERAGHHRQGRSTPAPTASIVPMVNTREQAEAVVRSVAVRARRRRAAGAR